MSRGYDFRMGRASQVCTWCFMLIQVEGLQRVRSPTSKRKQSADWWASVVKFKLLYPTAEWGGMGQSGE